MPKEKKIAITSAEAMDIYFMLRDLLFLARWHPDEAQTSPEAVERMAETLHNLPFSDLYMECFVDDDVKAGDLKRFKDNLDALAAAQAPDAIDVTGASARIIWKLSRQSESYALVSCLFDIIEGDARRAGFGEAVQNMRYDDGILAVNLPVDFFDHGQLDRMLDAKKAHAQSA